jgi:tetratricopeptide (TPR) repeat protein
LVLVSAKGRVFAAASPASTSFSSSDDPLKAWLFPWLKSLGEKGVIVIGVAGLLLWLLSQAQNIEATLRMLGQGLSKGSKPPEPQPPPVEPIRPINITLQQPPPPPDPRSMGALAGALTNLPPARPGFVARVAELDQLARALAPEAAQAVIHGMPGVGKTTLALHYAHSASAFYPGGVWWLDASQGFELMVLEAVTELETRIPGLGAVEGLNLEARMRRCFQNWPGGTEAPVLLVVDNLPPPGAGVAMVRRLTTGLPSRFRRLFTQRASTEGTGNMKLPVLDSADALELLKIRSGESGRSRIASEAEEARALVEDVGRLSLAVVLLGGRLQRVPSLTVSDLRKDLAHFALDAQAFSDKHASFLDEQGVVATLLSSWNILAPEAQELARLLSLTLPAPIPWELIERCVPSDPPAAPQLVNRYWEDGLAELAGANLLDALDGDHPIYALHPLVRQFFSLQCRGWEPEPHWRRELAVAARALAEGCQGEDLPRSVEFWRQACEADPADVWAAYGLGYALIPLGDSEGAMQAFEQSRRNAEAANDPRGVSCALTGIGDVLVAQGNGPGALAVYQNYLMISEDLAKRNPANTLCQLDLVISHNKIGDVLMAQGDGPASLAAYQEGLTIAEDLAKRDPANTGLLDALSISQERIGNLLLSQGDAPGALAAHQAALAIRENLAKRDPANTEWQLALWVSKTKMGEVLVFQRDSPGMIASYQAGLTIAEDLAKRDPANTQWQRNLSISHSKIGDVLMAQGDGSGALAAYQAGLAIAEDLAKRVPANTQWQRDLSISHEKIADVILAQGDGSGALASYQACLTIREDLAKRDPANKQWQRDLSFSHEKMGDVLKSQGDGTGALTAYKSSLQIREALAMIDPGNTQWKIDVANSCKKLGTLRSMVSAKERKAFLELGRRILISLKNSGHLHPDLDEISWYERALKKFNV